MSSSSALTFDNISNSEWTVPFLLGQEVCAEPPCECSLYYTGRSDWINAEGYLCHVNIWAVRALWILNILVWIAVVLFGIPKFLHVYERFFKKIKLSKLPPIVLVVIVMFGIIMPCCLTVGFIRIFDEEARIPYDLRITLPWFFGRSIFYCCTAVYQPLLLRKILEAENMSNAAVQNQITRERIVSAIAASNSLLFIPVYLTGGTNIPLARACFAVYLVVSLFCLLALCLTSTMIDNRLKQMLAESYVETKSAAILTLQRKLHSVQRVIKYNAAFQTLLYLVWLVTPPLWVAHDYILPLIWLAIPMTANASLGSVYIKETDKRNIETYRKQSKAFTTAGNRESGKIAFRDSSKLSSPIVSEAL